MTEAEKTAVKERIAAWQRAAPILDQVRDEDIRSANTMAAIESFQGWFQDAAKRNPPSLTSGLVEQQRCFMRAKAR